MGRGDGVAIFGGLSVGFLGALGHQCGCYGGMGLGSVSMQWPSLGGCVLLSFMEGLHWVGSGGCGWCGVWSGRWTFSILSYSEDALGWRWCFHLQPGIL